MLLLRVKLISYSKPRVWKEYNEVMKLLYSESNCIAAFVSVFERFSSQLKSIRRALHLEIVFAKDM